MGQRIDIDALIEGAIELREGVESRKQKSDYLASLANRAKAATTDEEREAIRKELHDSSKQPQVISLNEAIMKIVRSIGNYEHINSQSNHRKDIT